MVSYRDYLNTVNRDLWLWADRHHRGALDGGTRQGRPPVLAKMFASTGILTPPNASTAEQIQAAIPKRHRHRWFRSLKSSQVLCQSVFGAIRAFDRFDLLQDVVAECGRPAFYRDFRGVALELEYEVDWLGEPRPTSIDALLRGSQELVAVECKFTESEFGTCSRPRLRPGDENYSKQYCDGSYRIQRGRQERCALTEVGIRYWQHLPEIFDWPADIDHVPCPLRGVYQLARNVLASSVMSRAQFDCCAGHALVVYDARNPEFLNKGKADGQFQLAIEACRLPGRLRRLSWQRLLLALAEAPELAYLVKGVEEKYGLRPE